MELVKKVIDIIDIDIEVISVVPVVPDISILESIFDED